MGQYFNDTISPGTATVRRNVQGDIRVKGRLWIWETGGFAGTYGWSGLEGQVLQPMPANGFRIVMIDTPVSELIFAGNGAVFVVDFGSGYEIGPPYAFLPTGAQGIQAI